MENLSWLALFSDEVIGCQGDTSRAMMVRLLQRKLPSTSEMRDLMLLVRELDIDYVDRLDERVT